MKKTKVVKDDLNPVWDQTFVFRGLNMTKDLLEVTIMDDDSDETFGSGKDNTLGQVKVRVADVSAAGFIDKFFDVGNRKGKSWAGTLSMRLEWAPAR